MQLLGFFSLMCEHGYKKHTSCGYLISLCAGFVGVWGLGFFFCLFNSTSNQSFLWLLATPSPAGKPCSAVVPEIFRGLRLSSKRFPANFGLWDWSQKG